jgi:hypothetical protein
LNAVPLSLQLSQVLFGAVSLLFGDFFKVIDLILEFTPLSF